MAIEDKNINTLPQGNIEENNTVVGVDEKGFAVGYTFKKLLAWLQNELEKAGLKRVEDVLTMAELRTKVGVSGQYKNLLGYYEAGDKPSLLYKWISGIKEDDGGSVIVVGDGYWEACLNGVVYLEDFGVYNNMDVSDLMNKIFQLGFKEIDTLNNNNLIVSNTIFLSSNLIFNNTGKSVFKLKDSRPGLTPIFKSTRKNNITINGIITEGNRHNQNAGGAQNGGSHGIYIEACDNVSITNCEIKNHWTDGIYIGAINNTVEQSTEPSKNISIKNCISTGNRRQGLSVICVDGLNIEDCEFSNTQGVAPQAGIDFEPNQSYEYIKNVNIKNVKCINNTGRGVVFQVTGSCQNIYIENSDIIQNSSDNFTLTGGGSFENFNLKNCNISNINFNSSSDTSFKAKNVFIERNNINEIIFTGVTDAIIKENVIKGRFIARWRNNNIELNGNIFRDFISTETTQSDSVVELSKTNISDDSSGFKILNNYFLNITVSSAIYLSNRSPDVLIKGNLFKNITGNAFRFQGSLKTANVTENYFNSISDNVFVISSNSENIIIENNNYTDSINNIISGSGVANKNKIKLNNNSNSIKSANGTLPDLTGNL